MYLVVPLLLAAGLHCSDSNCSKPIIVGHRGTKTKAPENTIAAFEHAVAKGVEAVEMDVKASADEELFTFHDKTTGRTTDDNENRKVNELTWDELSELDAGSWFAGQFAGEKIPTLAEAIAVVPFDIELVFDLKSQTVLEPLTNFIHDNANQYGLYERLIIASFNEELLEMVAAEFPEIRIAYFMTAMSQLKNAKRFKAKYVRVPRGQDGDEDLQEQIREAGYVPIISSTYLNWEGVMAISNTPAWSINRRQGRKPDECQ